MRWVPHNLTPLGDHRTVEFLERGFFIPAVFAVQDEAGGIPDAELVRRCQGGDRLAFDSLVVRYQRMVYTLAYRMLGDPEEALDLAQESFLQAFKGLKRFRGDAAFSTWLHRIVINQSINRRKRWIRRWRDRMVSLDTSDDPDLPPLVERLPGDEDPDRDARQAELSRRIQHGLSLLTPEHRAILILRDIEGLSYQEVGEALGLTEGTVKSRLWRARAALKEQLEGNLE